MAQARTCRVLLTPRIWLSGLVATGLVPVYVIGTNAAHQAWFGSSASPLLTGFLLGAGLASVPWIMWTLALSVDGSTNWRIGAQAEQWTARELQKLGASWRVQHSVPFPENGHMPDVDHVAIGPCGVLAVETKWTSGSLDLGAKRLPKMVKAAVRQAEGNAGRVQALLSRVADIDVIPLLVYWGRDVTPPADPVRREGNARIVAGRQASLWRPLLNTQRLNPQMVNQLSERVHDWMAKQEEQSVGVYVRRHLQHASAVSHY